LKELKVHVKETTCSAQPGLALAKRARARLEDQALGEQRTGAITASGRVRIADLLPLMESDYSQQGYKSWADQNARWRNHMRAVFADTLAAELSRDMLNSYVARRQRDGAEPGSVNRELSVLRRMLTLGHAAGKVLTLPSFPHLKEDNVRQGFVTQREYNLLVPHAAPLGVRGLLCVGYSYGFRRGELLSLRVRQVDLASGTIELERKQTKNDQCKVVVMTGEVKSVLALCVAGKEAEDRVFTWPHGGRIRDFRAAWKKLFVAAGVPLKMFHDLRRSAVRNMVMRGVPTGTAMQISGHRTMSVFLRYNIQSIENLRDAALKIAAGAAEATQTDNPVDEHAIQ
jgi:integrase